MNRRTISIGGSLLLAAGLAVSGCGSSGSIRGDIRRARPSPARRSPGAARRRDGPARGGLDAPGRRPGQHARRGQRDHQHERLEARCGLDRAAAIPDGSHTDGAYATTPVIVNGVVYVQDLQSNVMAISLATGKVLWTHTLQLAQRRPGRGQRGRRGRLRGQRTTPRSPWTPRPAAQLWSRTVIGNDHEGIDMTPGYNHGTVYVSTVPVNPTVGEYLGGGKGILWALNAATGAPEWSWDEVQDLWGHPGGQLRRRASGTRRRSTPRATCTSAWPTPPRSSAPRATRWGAAGRVRTCTPTRWSS